MPAYDATIRGINFVIVFHDGHHPDHYGLSQGELNNIDIYTKTKNYNIDNALVNVSDVNLMDTLIHEITHMVDYHFFGMNDFQKSYEKLAVFLSKFAREILNVADEIFEKYRSERDAQIIK